MDFCYGLRLALKELAAKITPKIYEYGFCISKNLKKIKNLRYNDT